MGAEGSTNDGAELHRSRQRVSELLSAVLRSAPSLPARAAGRPVAILADLSGPKMRIGKLGAEKIELKAGDRFTLTADDIMGDQHRVSVSFGRLPEVVKRGDLLSLNDGYIQLEVVEVRG